MSIPFSHFPQNIPPVLLMLPLGMLIPPQESLHKLALLKDTCSNMAAKSDPKSGGGEILALYPKE